MEKIGRNDICTCGSGKKYKKCCGKNNVVSLELVMEQELQDIQLDIIRYAMKNYQEEMEEYLEQRYEEFDIPDDAMEIFHFYACTWFTTSVELNEKTILAEYIDRHIDKFNRQRKKDILQSWKTARPSVSIIQQDENEYVTLQDIFTKEVHKVKVAEEDKNLDIGGLVLGTIFPVGATSLFFTTFLDLPADESKRVEEDVLTFYENSGETDPVNFMETFFLEMLDLFLFGTADLSIEDLQWRSPKHMEVAVNYQKFMEASGSGETLINVGMLLWHKYCLRRDPTIKKPSVYVAALIYLVDQLLPFGGLVSQKDLAEAFDVSNASISAKFKEMEDILSDDIDDLSNILEDVDYDNEDLYGDDIFEEDDFDEDDYFFEEKSGNPFMKSRITMERELLSMEREMADKNFKSIDEMNDFMNKRLNSRQSSPKPLSDKEKAQELLFEAYESTGNKRKQLVEKALKLYPNSPDAYNILAEYEKNPEEQKKLYLMAIEAGEKELGQAFFKENQGDFWGIVNTRPYMRAKYNYALLLHGMGMLKEAIEQYEELLELNDMDNQGVRYQLFVAYVENGVLQKAESLLKQYHEEITAHGMYNKLLIEYLQNGPSQKAKKQLKKAKDSNPYVIDYLIQKKKLPRSSPAAYGLGDESEAIVYAEQHLHLWRDNVELIEWLKESR